MFTKLHIHKHSVNVWRVSAKLEDGTVIGVRGTSIFGALGKHGYFINGKPTHGTGVTSPWHRYAKYWPELIKIGKEA